MVKSKLPTRAKLVLVGDDGSGKTCLCTVYAHKKFPVVCVHIDYDRTHTK